MNLNLPDNIIFFKQLSNIKPFSLMKAGLLMLSIIILPSKALASDSPNYITPTNYTSFNLLIASNETISADQAAKIAKQGKKSKVLKISKIEEDGHSLYRVKVLTPKGHVRYILIDAFTGSIVQGRN